MDFRVVLCATTFFLGIFGETDSGETMGKQFYNIMIQRSHDMNTRDLMCSGALISYEKVLTVAHCFFLSNHTRLPNENFAVLLGDLGKTIENSRVALIKDIRIHPEFNPNGRMNDLAIVVLEKQIEIAAADIVPIGMATYNLAVGTECAVTTWLSFLSGWSITDTIQVVPVVMVETEKCFRDPVPNDADNLTICTYQNDSSIDGTYFLAGAPLVCNNLLVGISTQTIHFNQPMSLEAFARISLYWSWITNNDGILMCFNYMLILGCILAWIINVY